MGPAAGGHVAALPIGIAAEPPSGAASTAAAISPLAAQPQPLSAAPFARRRAGAGEPAEWRRERMRVP